MLTSFFASDGFTISSSWIEFSIALSGIYLTPIRDALGACVVPFITAYAVTSIQQDTKIEIETRVLFLSIVGIFLLSILAYCAIKMRIDVFLGQLSATNQTELSGVKVKLLSMAESYVKEVLAYISLLLGISKSSKGGRQ
jgi:hypothetical protein